MTPEIVRRTAEMIGTLLGDTVVGIYLYGSAVMDGLQKSSDVDLLVVTNNGLSETIRDQLTKDLLRLSGKSGNLLGMRPLEVTIVNRDDIIPWRYPPRYDFMYGEWLREDIEAGQYPRPEDDPDFAILLEQARQYGVSLCGPKISDLIDPVPAADIRSAIQASIPQLIEDLSWDTRNVILTLARMWLTVSTGEIGSKNRAAQWAVSRLPETYAVLLDSARRAYLGEAVDDWQGRELQVNTYVQYMIKTIHETWI